MTNVIAAPAAPVSVDGILADARRALVKTTVKTGDVIKTYAKVLGEVFHLKDAQGNIVSPWYELKGKDAKGIKAERAAFVADMAAVGHAKGTIDVYWQRVKEASGYVTAGNRVKGSESTDDKTMADLRTILNRIFKAEEAGEEPKASDYKAALMDVYAALGGDIDNLG